MKEVHVLLSFLEAKLRENHRTEKHLIDIFDPSFVRKMKTHCCCFRVFPRPFRHGRICPSPWGTSAWGQSVNVGDHEGGIDIMGGT